MGMPLNKAYRMSLSLVSDDRITQSLWQHHTEPLTERNKQRYQNRGETVILLKNFPRGGMAVSLSIYYVRQRQVHETAFVAMG